MNEIKLVTATTAAATLLRELIHAHGDLMFHLSGEHGDGSAPMCYVQGEHKINERDLRLGEIEGCPFFIEKDLYKDWSHSHLIIDVVEGHSSGFSIESPRGVRFIIKSRLFTIEELEKVKKQQVLL